jgi:carbamoyl-phosphate synthase small subunit
MSVRMKAFLVLENGVFFEGTSFGYETSEVGEVVFNTSMAGYQEILTDPSYCKQIVTLTYPMIGNYGISPVDMESAKVQVSGLVVKEYVECYSNYKGVETLSSFLKKHKVPAISGIDTRKLTRFIRINGAPRGGLFFSDSYQPSYLEQVKTFSGLAGLDLAKVVTTKAPYPFGSHSAGKPKVAVYDFGVKTNILKKLDESGFAVTVFPAEHPVDALLTQFDAFFLSNGPGDPEPVKYGIENTRKILNAKKPLFGICLGHQIIGLAMGRKTEKLKFGHRGGNQPVINTKTRKVEITSQNHGFTVVGEGDRNTPVTHINLNDNTIEGLRSTDLPVIAVQYHPESSPGPHDAEYIFTEFFEMVKTHKN